MAFIIESEALVPFLLESKIKLPRFQRKATWKEDQKFQLCTSVFKGYPVGVVIYNKTKDAYWLLDGRQRRNALKTAWENPVVLYKYARAFLKFNANAQPDEIRDLFWVKVNSFLQKDKSEEKDDSSDVINFEDDESVEIAIDPEEQKSNLKTLLDLILMVHKVTGDRSAWEKRFDFSKFFSYLPYMTNKKIDPLKLKKWLVEWQPENLNPDKDFFVKWFLNEYPIINDKSCDAFKEYIDQKFELLKRDIKTLREAEKIFSDARIGVIKLTNVTPLDAQNIFSLINKGGTQLKAEELLSAKPFWNERVCDQYLDYEVYQLVQNLYKDLNIPGEDAINTAAVVRWDICATLLDRIDKNHLFFPIYKQEKDNINMNKITLGFKLTSAELAKGISAKHIEKMESYQNWEEAVQTLIVDVNKISEILLDVNFYKMLHAWNKSIIDLLGNAATLEFISILRKDWINFNRPTIDGKDKKRFINNSLILFDKLIYEYTAKEWRGSGDNKMAKDVENISERFKVVPNDNWELLIENLFASNDNYKRLGPVLYYFAILSKKEPENLHQMVYDIDHIIPESMLDDHPLELSGYNLASLKDTLGNLALLPKPLNIKKTDKLLKDISDDHKEIVSKYSDIKIEDFDKYSDVSKILEMFAERKQVFMAIIKEKRESLFANGKLV